MAAMIFLALIGNLFLLPSLLGGVLGAMMEKVVQREAQRKPAVTAETDHFELRRETDPEPHVIPVSSTSVCPPPHFITLPESAHSVRRTGTSDAKIDA
jgi:hypothetical protein